MRSVLSATLMMVAAIWRTSAQAQMTPPSTAGAKPKPVTTIPIRPALQKPEETANAMAQAERLALQSDLAWVGQYNGAITGDVSERMVTAIKEFQKTRGGKPTGVLNPQERGVLADTARRQAGKCRLEDRHRSRHRRAARHPDQTGAAAGQRRQRRQMDLADRHHPDPAGAAQGGRSHHRKARRAGEEGAAGRNIDYTVVKPDFFVLSGLQGLKKFYLRGTFKGDEVRILTILYDQATENTVEPVVIAMSSAFNAFPSGAQIAGPPPRKTVEYGTGIVVSDDGAIVADRQITDGCLAIAIAGFGNADRVAEDKEHDLALLRIYGARGLKPLNLAGGAAKTALELTGIADPQNQGGGAAVSSVKASVAQVGGGSDVALSPPPALGFSGAAALDSDGKFAGIALLKPVLVAGTAERRAGGAGGAGVGRYRARFPQGQWRERVGRIVGCQGVRGARDLRAEVAIFFSQERSSTRHASPNLTPARASPPAMPIGVPSARQQAAPDIVPSSWNWIAFMPPATVGTACTLWPIAASLARTLSGTASSTSSALPSVQTRGASTASCRLMPWSIRLISACIALGKIRFPPGRPSA